MAKRPAARKNPYDYVGRLHNEFLNELKRTAIELEGRNAVDANDLLASFLRKKRIKVSKQSLQLKRGQSWSRFSDSLPVARPEVSDVQRKHVAQILRNIDGWSGKNGIGAVQRALKKTELRISADRKLSKVDSALLLSVTAIAYHSLDYWLDAGMWNEPSNGVIYSAKDTVKKDVVGGLQGGATGSAGGTPLSTAVGAAVGAIRGSAGGAIKAGAKALWGKIKGLF